MIVVAIDVVVVVMVVLWCTQLAGVDIQTILTLLGEAKRVKGGIQSK